METPTIPAAPLKSEAEARVLFNAHNAIGAIRLLRASNDLSLYEAKQIVDRWWPESKPRFVAVPVDLYRALFRLAEMAAAGNALPSAKAIVETARKLLPKE